MRVLLAVAIAFPAVWVSVGEVPIAHWTLDRDDVKDSQLRTRWAQGRARRTDGVHGDALMRGLSSPLPQRIPAEPRHRRGDLIGLTR